MRTSRRLLLVLPLPLLALVWGCFIVSGQITFVENFGNAVATQDSTVGFIGIDLNTVKDYEDHRDKIRSVETVGFQVEVTNLRDDLPATAEVYLSMENLGDPTAAEVQQQAVRVFSAAGDPVAPRTTRVIDFEESQAYMENFGALQDAVREGVFNVYFIAAGGTSVAYRSLSLVVTINAEM
jgi:predicted RNA-binding protein with RPS1 domain